MTDTAEAPTLGEVFAEERHRRRVGWTIAAVVGSGLVLAVIVLAVVVAYQAGKLDAAAGRYDSQSKTVASQQKTILNDSATIKTYTGAAAAGVRSGQHRLLSNFDALDFVIIDAISGNKVALQRDLRLLQDLLAPP